MTDHLNPTSSEPAASPSDLCASSSGDTTPSGQRKLMNETLTSAVAEMERFATSDARHALAIARYLCAADWLKRNGVSQLDILLLSGIDPEDYTAQTHDATSARNEATEASLGQ